MATLDKRGSNSNNRMLVGRRSRWDRWGWMAVRRCMRGERRIDMRIIRSNSLQARCRKVDQAGSNT